MIAEFLLSFFVSASAAQSFMVVVVIVVRSAILLLLIDVIAIDHKIMVDSTQRSALDLLL